VIKYSELKKKPFKNRKKTQCVLKFPFCDNGINNKKSEKNKNILR